VYEGAERGPEGFDIELGPAALAHRTDVTRPLVLVSTWSGLLAESAGKSVVYVACFRNLQATVDRLADEHTRVALLSAGFGGEERCEDRIAAAWIARKLVERGFEPDGMTTVQEMASWGDADMSLVSWGKSADYLRRQKRDQELEFVLGHHDDLSLVCRYEAGEIFAVEGVRRLRRTASGAVRMAYISASAMAAGDPTAVRDNVVEFVRGAGLGRKAMG
jgi:phosphosulfolactate phosphohydrolase-like enzyme